MSKKLFSSAQGASMKWAVGLGVAAALSVGAAATGLIATTGGRIPEQPKPTLEAVATVTPMPTRTPEIDLSYYEPREWPTPMPAATPTPTLPPYMPLPLWTPPVYFQSTPEFEEPTATPTAERTPMPKPTPTVTPIPTPSLEERIEQAKAVIEKYRNDYTTVITDYATIKPIVDALIPVELKGLYDNTTVSILSFKEFNARYCDLFGKNELRCVELLNSRDIPTSEPLAFATGGGGNEDFCAGRSTLPGFNCNVA